MFNFAYGSNLSLPYLHEYCPSAKFVMRAWLPNFTLDFLRFSTDMQGGISSLKEAPGELLHGVIYDISEKEILELDILEDIPLGLYRRDTYLVLGDDGAWHHADLYRVVTPTGPYEPAIQYLDYMINGATDHGLDPAYIKRFQDRRAQILASAD